MTVILRRDGSVQRKEKRYEAEEREAGREKCREAADRIARIVQMESILDEVIDAVENHPDAVREDAALGEKINTLFDYYENGLWLQDYAADEAGEVPTDLKRGVLAQDTLYDLLYCVEQLRG